MGFDAAYVTLQEHTIQAGRCDTSYALRSLDGDITREQILDGIAASCERAREAFPDLDEITEVYAFARFAQHEEGWWLVQPNSFEEPETLEPLAGDDVERGEYECPETTTAQPGTATDDDSNTGPTDEVVEQSGVQVVWAPVAGGSNAVNQELLSTVQGIASEHDGYVEQHGDDVVVRITGTGSDFERANLPLAELFARQSVEFERQDVNTVEFVMLGDRSGQDGIVAEFPAELTSEDARSICERSVAAGAAACTAGTASGDTGASGFIELFGAPAAPDAATFIEQYVPQDFVDSDDLWLAAIRLPA